MEKSERERLSKQRHCVEAVASSVNTLSLNSKPSASWSTFPQHVSSTTMPKYCPPVSAPFVQHNIVQNNHFIATQNVQNPSLDTYSRNFMSGATSMLPNMGYVPGYMIPSNHVYLPITENQGWPWNQLPNTCSKEYQTRAPEMTPIISKPLPFVPANPARLCSDETVTHSVPALIHCDFLAGPSNSEDGKQSSIPYEVNRKIIRADSAPAVNCCEDHRRCCTERTSAPIPGRAQMLIQDTLKEAVIKLSHSVECANPNVTKEIVYSTLKNVAEQVIEETKQIKLSDHLIEAQDCVKSKMKNLPRTQPPRRRAAQLMNLVSDKLPTKELMCKITKLDIEQREMPLDLSQSRSLVKEDQIEIVSVRGNASFDTTDRDRSLGESTGNYVFYLNILKLSDIVIKINGLNAKL